MKVSTRNNLAPSDTSYKQIMSTPPAPVMGYQITVLWQTSIRTGWMAGTAPKTGHVKSRSDNFMQISLDLRYLPQTNIR